MTKTVGVSLISRIGVQELPVNFYKVVTIPTIMFASASWVDEIIDQNMVHRLVSY